MNKFDELMNDGRIFTTPKWENSKYEKIKTTSTTTKGNLGEDVLEEYLKSMNFKDVRQGPNDTGARKGEWDIGVFDDNLNVKFEVKVATEDTNGGFQFNGLRPNKDWDYAFCLGVCPNDIFFVILSHDDLISYCDLGNGKKRKAMDSGTGMKYSIAPNKMYSFEELENELKKIFDERLERIKK